MLRKLVREEKPDAIAVAMDPRGGSFRRQLVAGYKATRDAQPEDLTAQLPIARELNDAWRLPVLEVAGFEADDVIATLAVTAPPGWEVVIVSSDKDLMQLVGGRVVWRPFLDVPRAALRAAAAGLPWVDDPTNADPTR